MKFINFDFKKRFPSHNILINLQKLNKEWRQHGLLDLDKYELYSDLEPEVYWRKVFKLKKPILKKVIHFILLKKDQRIVSTLDIC